MPKDSDEAKRQADKAIREEAKVNRKLLDKYKEDQEKKNN